MPIDLFDVVSQREETKSEFIRGYNIYIPKSELQVWEKRGFEYPTSETKSFTNIHDEELFIMVGVPKTLSEVGEKSLIGSTIKGYTCYLGTYGMGGPGFFGLKLDKVPGEEYEGNLVYAVWGADRYIQFDERIVSCLPGSEQELNPWYMNYQNMKWDKLTPILEGSKIDSVKLSNFRFVMDIIDKNGHNHLMEFTRTSKDPEIQKHHAFSKGNISDNIVFAYGYSDLFC